jgi:PAS domain S-box-containing protein
VNRQNDLDGILAAKWREVLQRVEDAVLVLDHQRMLRFVNSPARRLLGYAEDQAIGGRCRLTTRGSDCENACPLTFALESKMRRVDNFATVYRTSDGRAVPLNITVIPLHDDEGEFLGAVEILRPRDPDPGFFLAGSSPAVQALRERLTKIGRARDHVVLVGERPACRDVGRAVHRFSGLPEELFQVWAGSWEEVPVWPPGTMYADGDAAVSLLGGDDPPDGWRIVIGVGPGGLHDDSKLVAEVVELPAVEEIRDDLAFMVAAWADSLASGTTVSPDALQRLGRLARGRGLERLEQALVAAVAIANGRIEDEHVPTDGYGSHLVDELLQTEDPLAALEGRLLTEVLNRSGWRMQEAADRLGVSRVTLWRKLKDHGIERPECDGAG